LTSFVRILQVDKGFQTQNILTMNLILPSTKYTEDNNIDQFYTQMVSRVEAVPGVVSAGIVSLLPLQGESWIDAVTAEGDQRPITERPQANYRFISPDYFKAIGIPLLDGRTFDERDRKIRAAIISQATAQALWPGQNPIGIRFKRANINEPPFEVIGVIADIRTISLQEKPGPMVYVPYWERLRPWASLVVRTTSNPTAIASGLRSAIWQIDNQVPITRLQTMEQLVDGSVAQRRFQLGLVSLFAISALLLASLGIYGIVAESVGSRTNEIGIRMALGADASRIRLMILREGLLPVALGIIIGVAASLAVGRLLSSLLFEVKASDPLILAGATLIMTLVAIAACYLPARKASRVDPLIALRYE
ncbi:MAG TPA: FtsX-like permease family protein, partial [Blastocatellia bacterium]|nr:FtsX-like permease family protein [Blastocatellia bacterium]